MLVSYVSSDEFKAAGRISRSATLDSIRLTASALDEIALEKFFDEGDKSEITFTAHYFSKMKELVMGRYLSSSVNVVVDMVKSDAKIKYRVEYLVKYTLPAEKPPEEIKESDFDAFARLNGLLNAWPYVRSLVSNLSSEVGLPLTLPLLRIAPQASDVKVPKPAASAAGVS